MTSYDVYRKSLDRELSGIADVIRISIQVCRARLDEATRDLEAGRSPNACGVIQSASTDLDMAVAQYAQLLAVRRNLDLAMRGDRGPREARLHRRPGEELTVYG
jgi:hypothetical protein